MNAFYFESQTKAQLSKQNQENPALNECIFWNEIFANEFELNLE